MRTDRQIVASYAEWAEQLIDEGWEMTLLTFMFNQLDSRDGPLITQQRKEVERIYGMILTRCIRRPNSTRVTDRPIWICCPDWPVFKHDKDHYRDVSVNDGLHHHATALTRGPYREKRSLSDLVDEEQALFSGNDKLLHRLHAEQVTHEPAGVVRYVLKWVERGRLTADDIFVLPRTSDEVRGVASRREEICHD